MKTTDILSELENVKEQYKTDSREEFAGKYFNKNKGRKILKFVLSGAALFVFAAFITLTVVTKYASKPDRMVSHGSGIGFEISKTALKQETLKPDGSHESYADLQIEQCVLEGGQPQEVNRVTPDYIMSGGSFIFGMNYDYSFGTGDNKGTFTKSNGDKVLWTYKWDYDEKTELPRSIFRAVDGGVLLINYTDLGFGYRDYKMRMIMLDDSGNELWLKKYDHDVGTVAGAYADGDTIYVVSSVKTDQMGINEEGIEAVMNERITAFVISEYSKSTGELKSHKEIPVQIDISSCTVRCLGKVDNGYVVMYYDLDYKSNLALISNDRGLECIISFGVTYEFCSAGYSNGKIYLSGKHMSPEQNMGADAYYYVYENLYWKYKRDIELINKESGDLLAKYAEETSAVLLVCDASLSPEQIYTQKGAYGGALEATETGLLWEVAQIQSVCGGPDRAANPFVYGSSRTYALDENSLIASFEDTAKSYVMLGVYYPYE